MKLSIFKTSEYGLMTTNRNMVQGVGRTYFILYSVQDIFYFIILPTAVTEL